MSDPRSPDDPGRPPIADAASLFDSNVVHSYSPPPAPEPAAPHSESGAEDEYGIDTSHAPPSRPPRTAPRVAPSQPAPQSRHFEPSDDDDQPVARPRPAARSDSTITAERASRHDIDPESDSSDRVPTRSKRRSSDRAIGFDDAEVDEIATATEEIGDDVDPIWTRGAEWGPDLVRVAAVAVATLVAAWFALSLSAGLMFLVLAIGGAVGVLLSYPILVTIERPVRITPEQAVSDFFAAASHHLPHYRRMWLLLSPTARSGARFADFGEFRAHWVRRVASWKENRGGRFTPLTFRISEFRGDKSVGHATSHVDYTVQVYIRGREADKPIATYRMMHGLVKGPDRMWYLNQATLTSSGR